MKIIKIITISFLLALSYSISSCNSNGNTKRIVYKYRIEGNVKYYKDGQQLQGPAIAYTDTIFGKNSDSIWYYNSNGSKLTIIAPYKVFNIQND